MVVSRSARPGHDHDLHHALLESVKAASRFPGHLGADVQPPDPPANPRHLLIFRFATEQDLDRWNASPQRQQCLAAIDAHADSSTTVQRIVGLEAWFRPPQAPRAAMPARWKMALVTGVVIYVLALALGRFVAPSLEPLPLAVRTAVTTLILVPLMTWVAMPLVTRLLRRWLF